MEPDRLGRRVWALFTPYRASLVAIVVAVLVSSGMGIITPFLTQAAFDRALFPLGGGPVRLGLLAWLVAGMVAISVVSALIGVYQTYQTTLLGNRVMADLRGRLFEHLLRLDLAFFTATRTGTIQSRLANDVGGVQSVSGDGGQCRGSRQRGYRRQRRGLGQHCDRAQRRHQSVHRVFGMRWLPSMHRLHRLYRLR